MDSELNKTPHLRLNPLTREWVLVSPHRTRRPWQGAQEQVSLERRPPYDESCYLCPGNRRSGGQQNPDYDSTFVFTNDFPALLPDTPARKQEGEELFVAESEAGTCKVVCFSPRHDLSVPAMSLDAVTRVIEVWKDEYREFRSDPAIGHVQIFENKGEIMGCSNSHPHCQIWASSRVPPIVLREQECQQAYRNRHGRPMLLDYLERELEKKERLVLVNEHFAVLVPYWATWPFETLILPRRHLPSMDRFSVAETTAFADAYRSLTGAYDRVFDCEFPYTAGIHQAPATAGGHEAWQLHMHFYPPLLRSATVKKFMVGYEMLAAPQRDITPESAAETLRRARNRAQTEDS